MDDELFDYACSHCGSTNTARMIYGYTDDSDEELNARDGKDLYLAGCVPDRFMVKHIVKGSVVWKIPKRYCNDCKEFHDFTDNEGEALTQSP